MSLSEIIQVLTLFFSCIFSLVAIFQSKKSINITEKSILEANRPQIAIYAGMIASGYYSEYLIIKNFGKTPAIIRKISFSEKLDPETTNFLNDLIGFEIMPGQMTYAGLFEDERPKSLEISIEYADLLFDHENNNLKKKRQSDRYYSSTFKLNFDRLEKIPDIKLEVASDSMLDSVKYALHEHQKINL